MNYRHVYHAGNFADVLKHAVLTRLIVYLQRKEGGFRLLDTHAGAGSYDLGSQEAQKTGEYREGIARLLSPDALSPAAERLLQPYLDVVRSLNGDAEIRRYPGSPRLARELMRKQDRLSAIELHPQDFETLRREFGGDHRVRVTRLDGWLALGAHLPPKEKRAIVLVDPPFEAGGEYDRLVDGLARAHRRFATGVYCLWYPLKNGAPVAGFHEKLKASGIRRILCAELAVRAPAGEDAGLSGSGLIVVNPPFTLEEELGIILPELATLLGQGEGAGWRTEWLAGEDGVSRGDGERT